MFVVCQPKMPPRRRFGAPPAAAAAAPPPPVPSVDDMFGTTADIDNKRGDSGETKELDGLGLGGGPPPSINRPSAGFAVAASYEDPIPVVIDRPYGGTKRGRGMEDEYIGSASSGYKSNNRSIGGMGMSEFEDRPWVGGSARIGDRSFDEKMMPGGLDADKPRFPIPPGAPMGGPPKHPGKLDTSGILFETQLTRTTGSMPRMARSRNDPYDVQSSVVSVCLSRGAKLYSHREKNHETAMIVPLGDINCFDIPEGMIVFATDEINTIKARQNIHDADTLVTCTPNGARKGTQFRVLGVSTGKSHETAKAGWTAEHVTIQRGGTNTVKHTGIGTIRTGDWVAVSPNPAKVMITTNRIKRHGETQTVHEFKPAVLETGVPENMFRGCTFAFTYETPDQQFTTSEHLINAAIYAKFEEWFVGAAPVNSGDALDVLYKAGAEALNQRFVERNFIGTLQPLELYGLWHSLNIASEIAMSLEQFATRSRELIKVFEIIGQRLIEREAEYYRKLSAVGKPTVYSNPYGMEAIGPQWKTANVPAPEPAGYAAGAALIGMDRSRHTFKCTQQRAVGSVMKRRAMAQQFTWCKEMILGIAMSSAEPTEDFDIDLRPGGF